jgi:hypothetical protein
MAIEDNFPQMTDAQLQSLSNNVIRLATTGTPTQRTEAGRLGPLVSAELLARSAAALALKPVSKAAQKRLLKTAK